MKKIIILMGGFSEEREVSLVTGEQIAKELENIYQIKKIDPKEYSSYHLMMEEIIEFDPMLVFIALHGAEGEDGRIQAYLSLHNIKFTGSGYRASALAMDKIISSKIAKSVDVPVANKIIYEKSHTIDKEIACQLGFPLVIKPNDSGSSFGISIIHHENDIENAIEIAFKYSDKIICEQFIPGRELTVTIIDNVAYPVVEVKPKSGWYDYQNKYTKGNTIYEVPAKLSVTEEKVIKEYALKIYKAFGCEIYSRVDFRYNGEEFYFLEVNTLPGMTALSLTPMAAKEAGISFGDLLKKIIDLSILRC